MDVSLPKTYEESNATYKDVLNPSSYMMAAQGLQLCALYFCLVFHLEKLSFRFQGGNICMYVYYTQTLLRFYLLQPLQRLMQLPSIAVEVAHHLLKDFINCYLCRDCKRYALHFCIEFFLGKMCFTVEEGIMCMHICVCVEVSVWRVQVCGHLCKVL